MEEETSVFDSDPRLASSLMPGVLSAVSRENGTATNPARGAANCGRSVKGRDYGSASKTCQCPDFGARADQLLVRPQSGFDLYATGSVHYCPAPFVPESRSDTPFPPHLTRLSIS